MSSLSRRWWDAPTDNVFVAVAQLCLVLSSANWWSCPLSFAGRPLPVFYSYPHADFWELLVYLLLEPKPPTGAVGLDIRAVPGLGEALLQQMDTEDDETEIPARTHAPAPSVAPLLCRMEDL